MTIDERWKYLRLMKKRYQLASRDEKNQLLDEAESVTGLHRKSLIRCLSGDLKRKTRRRQRGRTYGPGVHAAIKVISESVDHICAERLQPNLVWLAQHLAEHGELEIVPGLLDQLGRISVSSVRRIIDRLTQDQPRLPRKKPTATNQVAKLVPIGQIPWDEQVPGQCESDLVHHCGPVADGHYVHTLQTVDIPTGWSERVAILGRSQRAMEDGFRRILIRVPFALWWVHTDNGSEFLNAAMIRFWQMDNSVTLSRGRPHHKNDQRFVEQKNATLVRAYLGYDRLDTVTHTVTMNVLYNKMWLFYNFFQPVMRLAEKTVITTETGERRVQRRYDEPRTPFDRLCETGVLSAERQEELAALRKRTNPRELCAEIHALIDHILSLPGAVPGETEDVFKTLLTSGEEERLRRAAGYVDKSSKGNDLPTYPQPLLLRTNRNGNGSEGESVKVKEIPVTLSNEGTTGVR